MIKGIVALFSSGIIFNPMVLGGIFFAVFCMIKFDADQMREIFMDYNLYALVAFISFAYTFLFKKIYKEGGIEMDYTAMILYATAGIARFVLACGLMISFIVMLSF